MSRESQMSNTDDNHSSDEDIDEYDLYYGENADIEISVKSTKTPGPLSRRPSATSALPLLFLSLLFLLCTSMLNNNSYSDFLWVSHKTIFDKHEYWRLFTALFTHADFIHLLSNIPLYFFFGLFLYEYFGFLLFPIIPLLIGIIANACTVYFYPDDVRLVGASGMVYGMASLWLILYIYHDTDHTIPRRILRSTGFALIILFPSTYNPTTSYLVHAVGFFTGIIFALTLLPFINVKARQNK